MLTFDVSHSKPTVEEYGIVAILVESGVYNDPANYDGLQDDYGSYLRDSTLAERVDRYAYDVQNTLAMTKSIIIEVEENQSTEEIAYVLEKLYFDGDDIEDENNHLVGVVVIGDVPLPVVTKGGNKFLSMLPYTDFDDKIYIFNDETGNFERNSSATELEPEAWHGVIVPPSDGESGGEQLAEYFDKNHLYHLGITEYSDFDQKLFYGDLVAEEKALGYESFSAYERFTDHWEEIAYNRYSRHLAEDLFVEAGGDIGDGDGEDNDGDGLIDEDPEDGIDNDGDGFIDEDLGDFFNGVDNDGDGLIDEDGVEDNDNDGDGFMDEDLPGDANGDGCPGTCNMDDDGDGNDTDGDGWPSGLERLMGWDPDKKSSPFLFKLRDESLQQEWKEMFTDEDPFYCLDGESCWDGIRKSDLEGEFDEESVMYDSRCFDEFGNYHPEWDDDEDGYCDEDTDLDNDADGDGQSDEDMGDEDEEEESPFEGVPDIQSKNLFEQLTSRYYDLFEKLISNSKEWTDYTGRYDASYTASDGSTASDVDSPMSLIATKDHNTIAYLRAVNDLMEQPIDTIVDTIQQDVKFVGNVTLSLSINFADSGPTIAGDPIVFVNHSASSRLKPFDIMINGKRVTEINNVSYCSTYLGTYDEDENGSQLVNGLRVYDVNTAGEYDEEGEDYGGCFGNYSDMSLYGDYVADLTYCFPEVATEPVRSKVGTQEVMPGEGDESLTPDYRACNDFREVRGFYGNSLLTDFLSGDASLWDAFSHLWSRDDKGYYYYAEEFLKELNKIFEDDHDEGDDLDGDNDYDEDDFAIEVEQLVADLNSDGAFDEPYRPLDEIYLFDEDYLNDELLDHYGDPDSIPDFGDELTLGYIFEEIGLDPDSQDDLTGFLVSGDEYFEVDVEGNDAIDSIEVVVLHKYVPNDATGSWFDAAFDEAFTEDESEAYSLSSVLKHDQPKDSLIAEQVEAQFSAALPIDDPRYVTFQDAGYEYREIYYPNIFDSVIVGDYITDIQQVNDQIAQIPGGEYYEDVLEEYFYTEIDSTELQDALDWMHMNIDEKHDYVFNKYLGPESAYVADLENGYEVAYMVGDGDPLGFNYSFNGAAKIEDQDFELNFPESNYDAEAIGFESGSGEDTSLAAVSVMTWIQMILEWVDGLSTIGDSLSIEWACGGADDGKFCYDDISFSSTDSDDDGIPDSAETSSYLAISADSSSKLYANGTDSTEVTVSILDANGDFYDEDSFTEIELSIAEGSEYGQVISANPVVAFRGVATFTVSTTSEPGKMYLQAAAINNNLNDSDYVSLESTLKQVQLYTYDYETIVDETSYTITELEDLVLVNENGDVLVSVNAATGDIEINDDRIEMEVLAADEEVPTRVGFYLTDDLLGVLYVVPQVMDFETGVIVTDMDEEDDYTLSEDSDDEILLWDGPDRAIVSVMSNGQIFIREDLGLKLELSENSLDSAIRIKKNGTTLAEVKIDLLLGGIDIVQEENYLSFWEKLKAFFGTSKAFAAQIVDGLQDTDEDGLHDLFEHNVGTDINEADTDGDGYGDLSELENGYDPLAADGATLFNDLNAGHEAYDDVLTLYLRGILGSYEGGDFRPDESITREEFTKLNLGGICVYCDMYSDAVRAEVEYEYKANPFPDSDISSELYYCVADAKNKGLVAGYKSGSRLGYFVPQNNISRAEAAKVILEAAALFDSSYGATDYTGSDKAWYYNYVVKAQSLGLFPGERFSEVDHYSSELFVMWLDTEPSSFMDWLAGDITRAEFAMMVARLIDVYDCRLDDEDGDGLSDNEELYVYGTDPYDPDTDDGGVTDFAEVVTGSDALDASDDENVDYEEIEDDTDDDDDWLYNDEENQIGTFTYDPDTDDGGVMDGREVLYGSDPFNENDDYFEFDGEAGIYAVGDGWRKDFVYSSEEFVETTETENLVYLDEIPADGKADLFLRAEVLNDDGFIDEDDSSTIIDFVVLDAGDDYAVIAHESIAVTNGVAETVITATTTSGFVEVTADVSTGLPIDDANVHVYPGDPTSLEFSLDSTVMAAGGVNKMDGRLYLYDVYGNVAYNDPYVVTLDVEGGSELANVFDEDQTTDGVQITTFEGYVPFSVISSVAEGVTTLKASYEELETETDVDILEGINFVFEVEKDSLTANGSDYSGFVVYAADKDGELLDGFNPYVTFSVADDSYGSINSETEVQLDDGKSSGIFLSSTVSGGAYVMVSAMGVEPGSTLIETVPGPVHELRIESVDGNNLLMIGNTENIRVSGYDQYGNFAYNDSETEVLIRTTDASSDYATLSDEYLYLEDGIADFNATAEDISGFLNLVATGTNLISGTLELEVRGEFNVETVQDMDPQVLYASLLGAPVGQVTYDDYFGGWFLINGKTQAISSLLDYPDPHKRMMQLDANGKSTLIEGNFLTQKVIPGGSSDLPTKMVWQDDPANVTLAEILIILDDDNGAHESDDLSLESEPGAYISITSTNKDFEIKQRFEKNNDELSLLYDDNEVVRLDANGQIKLYSFDYTLEVNEDYDYPAISVHNGASKVAEILLIPDDFGNVTVLSNTFEWSNWSSLAPGVYLDQHESSDYGFEVSFSGNSSASPAGFFLVDNLQTLPQDQSPSLGYSSLESAQDEEGVGLHGDNKNILLFSAGNTVGESNRIAASEIGVVLGDPTISLETPNTVNGLGHTKDIGRIILNGSEPIADIVPLDYNNDGLEDLLVAYESGIIKLLQNYEAEERFRDRGDLLNIVSGILSYDHADFDLDGYEDLIIATEEACIAGEVCVYMYKNNEGKFERINLGLEVGSQVLQIIAADMNNDDFADIVTSDNSGTIKVFFNNNGDVDTDGTYVGNVGVKIDSATDLGSEIYVYHDYSTENDSTTSTDDSYFYNLPIPSDEGFTGIDESSADYFADILGTGLGSLSLSSGEADTHIDAAFVQSSYDDVIASVSKYGTDVNGGIAEPGDEIEYVVTIDNPSTYLSDVYISDIAPTLLDLDLESFECRSGCVTSDIQVEETGVSSRPYVLHGVSIASGGRAIISYSSYVLSVPKVNLTVGNDLGDYHDDNYLDIAASPEGNPTGQVVNFYSNGSYIESNGGLFDIFSGLRIINYTQETSEPADASEQSDDLLATLFGNLGMDPPDFDKDEDGDGMPDDLHTDSDEPPAFLSDLLNNTQLSDSDGDGAVDDWDLMPSVSDMTQLATDSAATAGAAAAVVEGVLSSMICGGGCIAVPLNIDFLAPGMFNLFGVPTGFFPGSAIFGVTGNPPFVCTSFLCNTPASTFRLYLSITTTLGTALSFCVGSYPSPMCWAFNLPILQMAGVCDAISSSISDALSTASSSVSEGSTQVINTSSSTSSGDGSSGGLTSYSLDSYNISANFDSNIQVPGFPSVFTDWWKSQKEEIIQLLDLPDIYFIYPTGFGEAFGSDVDVSDLNGLTKVLTALNSLPIISIDTQPVTFTVPALSQDEFLKYQEDIIQLRDDVAEQFDAYGDHWKESGFTMQYNEVQDFLYTLDENIRVIDEYMELPRKIIEYRHAEAYFVQQIVCYIDAVITYIGGYIQVQLHRADEWKQAIKDVTEAFTTWQALFDVAIDYQDSCDKCTTQRGSLIELLMKLFIFIPDIPIVDLPKLPDIVIDVSQIQAGLEISFPQVHFAAEHMILPEIPSVNLPSLPSVTVSGALGLPALPILPNPPDLPDLPELPPLPLIELPDIPAPPEVPSLDASLSASLKVVGNIIKIICLVKQGILPTRELQLKTKVEDLTQRPLDVVFPFDVDLAFNSSSISYDFVRRIEVIAKMNLGLETDFIVEATKAVADVSNSVSALVADTSNQVVEGIDEVTQTGSDAATGVVDEVIDQDVNVDAEISYLNSPIIQKHVSLFEQVIENLNEDMEVYNETIPDKYEVIAQQNYIDESDLPDYDLVAHKEYDLIAGSPTESLVDLKNQLVAYIENGEQIGAAIESSGWDSMQHLLVQNSSKYVLASQDNNKGAWTNEHIVMNAIENAPSLTNEDLGALQNSMTETVSRLLADSSESDSTSSLGYDMPVTSLKGMFIYDEEAEVNERLINYTEEAGQSSNIVMFDMDNDGDDDIAYSYGGTIYLKENLEEEPDDPDHYTRVPRLATIDYFLPEIASVNKFTSGNVGNDEADMNFSGEINSTIDDEIVGYEIRYYDNLSDFDDNRFPLGKISLISEAKEETLAFYDEEGTEYTSGTKIETSGELAIASAYDDLILIPEDAKLTLSTIAKGFAYVSELNGDGLLHNSYLRTPIYTDGSTIVTAGNVLHALEDSEITIDLGADEDFSILLSQNTSFTIPTNLTTDLDIRVEKGSIEIIDTSQEIEEQTLVEGILLYPEHRIQITDEDATITLLRGTQVLLEEGQTYFFDNLANPDSPSISTYFENGTYYSQVVSVSDSGVYGTTSNTVLLAPQVCADDSSPYPDAGASSIDIAIFATDQLDASGSFDTDSEIVKYYWDTDLDTDSDGDGDSENDIDYYQDLDPTSDSDGDGVNTNDMDDPQMEIGPYDEAGTHYVKLWVVDEAGNAGSQLVTINVYVPDIYITDADASTGIVEGYTNPATEDLPFILIRDRASVVTQLTTESSDANGKFYTDDIGEFEVNDLDIESKILILNDAGETVAEFSTQTGQLLITDDRYAADILPTDLEWPTRLIVYEIASGEILQSILLVTDPNTDVTIEDSGFEFTEDSIAGMTGVHMKVVNSWDFEINKIGASDPVFPGSVEVVLDDERFALIGSDGNIYILNDTFDIELQEASELSEPLIIEMTYAGENLAEIYIALDSDVYEKTTQELGLPLMSDLDGDINLKDSDGGGVPDEIELIHGMNPVDGSDDVADNDGDGLSNAEEIDAGSDINDSDTDDDGLDDYTEVINGLDPTVPVVMPFADVDVDDPLFLDMYDMVEKGILSGYDENGLTYFLPEREINRAEFTKIILAILCITPGEEAFEAPQVFYDIDYSDNLPWYYDETKESYLRGFITGYLADIDPETGLTAFRPGSTITRAEATKIILEALDKEGFIELGDVEIGEPWWTPYMEIAQDLDPYLLGASAGDNNFIVTAEEAQSPTEPITRYEFIEMSVRALHAYNCYTVDTDGDGLSDWEEENIYGSDPGNPDTDFGGVLDGEEAILGTDILDDSDDDWDGDTLSNNDETNIYGTDPWNPDTDYGGVWDGVEVNRGSDPLDPSDDYLSGSLLLELDSGIYFVTDECIVCPCPSSIENGQQIMSGDIIHAAITNTDNSKFYSVSNEYEVK